MTHMNYAMVFPGQGSQSVGMLNQLADDYADVAEIFARASETLGYDLWKLVCEGPESELNKTEITQPALLVSAYACWQAWQDKAAIKPSLFAGHSLGEYTALVCAGVIEFEQAVKLVAERGKCMQQAVPAGTGAMAALLGLDDAQVEEVCSSVAGEQVVSAANYNAPGQVVIAGDTEAVEKAIDAAKSAGAKRAIKLPVSVPSHCLLMKPAAEQFATFLDELDLSDASVPVVQNVDATARKDANEIKARLLEQLYLPVRWVDSIDTIKQAEIGKIIECGPGKVLTGLNKRIDRSLELHCIQDEQSIVNAFG